MVLKLEGDVAEPKPTGGYHIVRIAFMTNLIFYDTWAPAQQEADDLLKWLETNT